MDGIAGVDANGDPCTQQAALARAIFALSGGEGACFDNVFWAEVVEARRIQECITCESPRATDTPEVIVADSIYSHLGADKVFVDPALAGRRQLVCVYGRRSGRHRVLQKVVGRVARELICRAESCASVKLFSLRMTLLECGLFESEANVVHDLLGQRIIDAAGISEESVTSIMRPLTAETLPSLTSLLASKPLSSSECSGHYFLHIEAEHANDVGTISIVSVASLEKMGKRLDLATDVRQRGCFPSDSSGLAAQQHCASLRRLSGLIDTFAHQHRGVGGGEDLSSLLLLLAPPNCAPRSHLALIAAECFRLRDEREMGASGDDNRDEVGGRPPAQVQRPVPTSSRCFTERHCVLPSPPASECLDWGSRECSPAPSTSSSRSGSPIPHAPGDAHGRHGSGGGGGDNRQAPGPSSRWTPSASPRQLLRLLAGADTAGVFDAEDWLRRVREEGKPPEEQVQDLLRVVLRMQQAHREVMQATRRLLQCTPGNSAAAPAASSASAPPASRPDASRPLRPSGGSASGLRAVDASGTSVDVAAPRNASPPIVVRRSGSGSLAPGRAQPSSGQAGALSAAAAAAVASAVSTPSTHGAPAYCAGTAALTSAHYNVGSPRWSLSEAEMKRPPVRQPSDVLIHSEDVEPSDTHSPLTRSRSANPPSGSFVVALPRGVPGSAAAAQGDTVVSPFVPLRDASPARSRSVTTASGLALSAVTATLGDGICGIPSPRSLASKPRARVDPGKSGSCDLRPVGHRPSQIGAEASCDDGIRSPLPAPAPQGLTALHYPKALDRTPLSARSGLVMGNVQWAQTAEGGQSRMVAMRWEQASPCRVRYVGGADAGGGGGGGGAGSGVAATAASVLGANAAKANLVPPMGITSPSTAHAGALPGGGPSGGGVAVGVSGGGGAPSPTAISVTTTLVAVPGRTALGPQPKTAMPTSQVGMHLSTAQRSPTNGSAPVRSAEGFARHAPSGASGGGRV